MGEVMRKLWLAIALGLVLAVPTLLYGQSTATKTLTITVRGPLSISTTTLSDATVGNAYSATLQAAGGLAPYSWSISTGSLPTGLTLAPSTGIISGTPTTSGTFTFTVKVTDSSQTVAFLKLKAVIPKA